MPLRTLLLTLFAAGMVASPAQALTMVRTVGTVDRSMISGRLSNACGFAIRVGQSGQRITQDWYDSAGNLVRTRFHDASFVNTFTNVATGKTVSSPHPLVVTTEYRPDGSFVVSVSGLDGRITSPGKGLLVLGAGHWVETYDANGELVSADFLAGKWTAQLPGICIALS